MNDPAIHTSYHPTISYKAKSSKGPFLQVPLWLSSRSEVSPGAKLAYARLKLYALKSGKAFPTIEKLAQDLQKSIRSCKNYLGELKKLNLIQVERRGRGKSNIYTFPVHIWAGQNSLDHCPIENKKCQDSKENSALLEVQFLHFSYKEEKDNFKKLERCARARELLPQEIKKPQKKSSPPSNNKKIPPPKPIRLTEDWKLPPEWRQEAGQQFGWSEERIGLEEAKFRNYWCSKAGWSAFKTNWRLVWQNWCLRDWKVARKFQAKPKEPETSLPNLSTLPNFKSHPLWARIGTELSSLIGAPTFISWFKDLDFKGIESGILCLQASTRFIKDWISTHFHTSLRALCSKLGLQDYQIICL